MAIMPARFKGGIGLSIIHQSTLAALLLVSSFTLFAAEIIIKVIDEGEAVPMAEVTLVDAKSHQVIHNGFTNQSGIYHHKVKPGKYRAIIAKETFADVILKNLQIKKSTLRKTIEIIPVAFVKENARDDDCD